MPSCAGNRRWSADAPRECFRTNYRSNPLGRYRTAGVLQAAAGRRAAGAAPVGFPGSGRAEAPSARLVSVERGGRRVLSDHREAIGREVATFLGGQSAR